MAKIDFNFWAYDYDHRIMVIADTLLAAEEALDAKSAQIEAVANKHATDVAAGIIESGEEYDDDTGAMIWSPAWGYDQDLEIIHEGVVSLRKSFVTSLYHLWERTAQRWTGVSSDKGHYTLLKAVRAKGVSPPDRLKHIQLLNNVLKHNSEDSGPDLLKVWPEIFPLSERVQKQVDEGKTRIEWSEQVSISKAAMEEIFAAIRASGPN